MQEKTNKNASYWYMGERGKEKKKENTPAEKGRVETETGKGEKKKALEKNTDTKNVDATIGRMRMLFQYQPTHTHNAKTVNLSTGETVTKGQEQNVPRGGNMVRKKSREKVGTPPPHCATGNNPTRRVMFSPVMKRRNHRRAKGNEWPRIHDFHCDGGWARE